MATFTLRQAERIASVAREHADRAQNQWIATNARLNEQHPAFPQSAGGKCQKWQLFMDIYHAALAVQDWFSGEPDLAESPDELQAALDALGYDLSFQTAIAAKTVRKAA